MYHVSSLEKSHSSRLSKLNRRTINILFCKISQKEKKKENPANLRIGIQKHCDLECMIMRHAGSKARREVADRAE